jgi:alpha(1,3/1,4) fucosyltransferase
MMRVRLDFCDFWPGFVKTRNYFIDLLSKRFEIEIVDKPDFIIYADFGYRHRVYKCARIFFSGEKTAPDFRRCDYAFTSHYLDDPRHTRWPFYLMYSAGGELVKADGEADRIVGERRKFCSFVVSNPKNKRRIEFFQKLSARRTVDSGGRILNNIGGPTPDKAAFILDHKFNIAFENRAQAGYTTEKIVEAMRARSIPIYWGNPLIEREFNPKSFLNAAEFASDEALIERVLEIDGNEELYRQYLREPFFYGNRPNEYIEQERYLDQFEKIFTTKIEPVGKKKTIFGRWTLVKRDR